MKKIESLLKSEVKKAEAKANKALGVKNCKVTAYSIREVTCAGCGEWYEAICEICHDYEERAEIDIVINIMPFDRRRSFAVVKEW